MRPQLRASDTRWQLLEQLRREVRRCVARAVRRHAQEHESGPAPDLQHAARAERENPLDRPVYPLFHFSGRQRLAGVAAVPSDDVEGRIAIESLLIQLFPDGLPLPKL